MKNMFIIRCKNIDFFIFVLFYSYFFNLFWDWFWVGFDLCFYNFCCKVLYNILLYLF